MMGGAVDLDTARKTYALVMRKLPPVLQGVDDLMSLRQEKGNVRSLGMLGVPAGRESGRRGFRTMPFFPPSLQITTRVSLLPLCYGTRGGSWSSRRTWWWC
jgi:hypothetical protein